MYKEMKSTLKKVVILAAIIIIIICSQSMINFNDTTYEVKITDKERIYQAGEKESKYLVFGEDKEGNVMVFENTDCIVRGKWNSSNLQGELKEGSTYRITVVGYRIEFLSIYQNIIKIEKAE